MDEQKKDGEQKEVTEQQVKPAGKYLRIKPFALIMLFFFTVLVTAGLTIFALTFGDQKAVEVKVPVERAEFKKLYEAYDALETKYYEDVNEEEIVYGAINGMFDALGDPYSDYMNKEEATSFNDSLSSSFQGIGAEIQERNGYIMIVSPIKNTPAEKAGLQPKDMVLAVDGKSVKGMSSSEAVLLIRGEKGKKVTLTIQRGEAEPMEVTLVRDDIPVETVYGDIDEFGIVHFQITSFSEDTAKELETQLAEYEKQGMKGIVLDVRQNPGGFLKAAIDISNLFVAEGKTIVQIQERDQDPQLVVAQGGKKYNLPITVLIDEGSASASEILAGALKESVGAKLIGLTSFGKGTMQEVMYMEDGANLKFTTGKWLTPDGNWINEKGIKPDVEVAYPDYASLPYIDPTQEYKSGDTNVVIESAERILEVLGYTPGEIDQTLDEQSVAALKQFQADNKLEANGILKGDTTYALLEKVNEKLKTDDPQIVKAKELLGVAK
ncbi:peptidase S41 [Lysinibacillus sp. 2017]|uniref:lmo1851 family serine protease n=1 Tax=unclassified Lysinibacillus TaxID=2636778 RepID=UPI000D52948A|nr:MULTISPECIES: S41 family peptidase [unclassified Lysinibacillus]AWE07448.1 peptidase S41 [Lysinibacillus sp. 2017]TGN36612.1 PDZ domain-containing protein [Lysinibacillus sp. S2017]